MPKVKVYFTGFGESDTMVLLDSWIQSQRRQPCSAAASTRALLAETQQARVSCNLFLGSRGGRCAQDGYKFGVKLPLPFAWEWRILCPVRVATIDIWLCPLPQVHHPLSTEKQHVE